MAIFQGTIQEFHHYIGPRIRNVINNISRSSRASRNGICEHCGKKKELQSAHVHGKDRRTLIEKVLKKYVESDFAICDLEQVEKEVINLHLPIEDTFKFLCQECHTSYDKLSASSVNKTKKAREVDDFVKLHRIKLWADRPNQDNHKMIASFCSLDTGHGVQKDVFRTHASNVMKVEQFDNHLASMKTDSGNSHGKVFYEKNNVIFIWPEARAEIDKFFDLTAN